MALTGQAEQITEIKKGHETLNNCNNTHSPEAGEFPSLDYLQRLSKILWEFPTPEISPEEKREKILGVYAIHEQRRRLFAV